MQAFHMTRNGRCDFEFTVKQSTWIDLKTLLGRNMFRHHGLLADERQHNQPDNGDCRHRHRQTDPSLRR